MKVRNISWKAGLSFNGESVDSMVVMPQNRIPKPSSRFAMFLVFFFLAISMMPAPIAMIIGAKEEGFRSFSRMPAPSRSPSRRI